MKVHEIFKRHTYLQILNAEDYAYRERKCNDTRVTLWGLYYQLLMCHLNRYLIAAYIHTWCAKIQREFIHVYIQSVIYVQVVSNEMPMNVVLV